MRFSDWSSDVCSSDLDTPWPPDDYVHRIGRTGRAGAKGRAFTLVAEDDAEAIANVEKLTGCKIDVFGKKDVRVELKSAPATAPEPATEEPEETPRRARSDTRSAPRSKPRSEEHTSEL